MIRKIVVSTCHGGFGLSRDAFTEWCRRKDFGMVTTEDRGTFEVYWAVTYRPFDETPEIYDKHKHADMLISARDIQRDDPDLVAVVEEMGERANDDFSCLKIVEIPSDVSWQIDEYDGAEWVAEQHRRWS